MKSKHSRLERKYKHYHIPAGDWQLNQDEAKELERRQQVLQGLNELSQSDPGGARAIPDIVFHNISSSRQRQLAEEYPARDGQSASKGHLDYVGAIKEGLNDEEFANLENSFHAYISLPAELQQKWQGDLRASKPDSDEYKSRKEYERAHTVWTAEGLCSLKKLAEEAQAAGYQQSESKPKPAVKPEVIPEPKQQDVEAQPQSIVGPETNPAEDAPNPADEKNWDNIENRRAVVRRLTMLGDAESAVVREAMAKSVYREYSLASLAFFESDGKASPSLAKRQHELYDDLKLARDKFSDSDTSTIFKVVSNFSNEQMDDLDKLVDEVAILAEKNPQGMERLRSNVRERSHELADEVHETALSDSLSSKEYHKREADLVGNFYSSVITQAREAAEAVTRKSNPKPAVKPEVIPEPKSKREFQPQPQQQKPEKEQPESPTKGKSRGEGQGSKQSSATSQPELAPQPRPETNPEPKSKGEFQPQPQQQKPVIQEKAEDKPNPTDEKNWDNIENRRAVVERIARLGNEESVVVQEAMEGSVQREVFLTRLAVLESDGKASPSLEKRRKELLSDLQRTRNINRGKFSDSDTSTISKVISNFSYEQMDDLDKLVDEVATLAEKNPQGMERLCSDVTERRYELAKKVGEIVPSDSLSDKEYYKRLADVAGNFYSSIIVQAREAAEAVTSKSNPKPAVKPETNPAEDTNPADKKDWDNIENRRAVVERIARLGDAESAVVREAMAESVRRKYYLASLAVLESDGKASPSLEKRRKELFDDLKWTNKFDGSDTSAIFKVISNFSYEQMDDLDKLVDAVAILAEKDPQGVERLRSDVTRRSHELRKKVNDTAPIGFLSDKEYYKWAADLTGNFNSRIIDQTREVAEAVTGKLKPKPEVIDKKNWYNIENRRAVVRRLTMLGDDESAVVREAMLGSVDREYYLASLAVLESDGKARASLKKRQVELSADLGRTVDIRGKFSDSDTGAIFKVISNFSYEQMDDLDKLVDAVAILAEKDPQGVERLRSDVTERRHELSKKVDEIVSSGSLSGKEYYKRVADLTGNFYSSIIDQTREAAETVTREKMSEYVGEQVLNDKMRSELLKQAFIRSLGQERLAELRQQYGGEVNSAAEMIVKSIRDADGLNGKERYRLNGLLNDLDALPDSDIRRIIQSDIFKNGVAGAKNRSGTEGAGSDFSAELRDLIHQKAGLEEFLAPRRKLTGQIFNRNVYEGARSLLYTELMMKSFSKERYEEVMETFRDGERTQFGDFIQCHNASEPGVPDPRGMTQEEFKRLAELTPLVLGLSKSQVNQLLESEEKEKTKLSKGDPNDPELWRKRQQYSAALEQRIRRMARDNDAENINMASVDRSRIVEMKAYIDAKRKLDKDLTPKPEDLNAKGKLKLGARVRGAVARLWKGKIFRDYYEFKYQRELKEQYSKDFAHTLGVNSGDGSASSAETEQALIWRMTRDSDFFTDTVGEEREQLSPDSEAYKAMRRAVETFVENGNEEAFIEETRRINNDLMGNEGMPVLDNYLTSAIYIKGQVDHGRALNDVMRGFKMYRGISAEGVNSGHHERAIDKLVAKFERKKTGETLFIKPEVVAGVAGLASWIGGAVARNRAVQAVSFGGSAVVAGVLAGVKENEQVKIDRADLARRIAEGGQVDEDNKYEMELAETLPEMRTAESYMEAMDQAIASGDADRMRQVLADLVVAREVGRNEGVDLIDYYSGGGDAEVVRNELTSRQFALEQAYIRTNKDPNLELGRYKDQLMDGLSAATQAYGAVFPDVNGALLNWDNVPENVREQIIKAYEMQAARDRVAKKLRRRRVAKEWAATTARTLAFSTIGQEIAAGFRSDVHGAFEDMLFGQHGDAPGAARTALGNLLNTPNGGVVGEVVAGGNQPEKQFYREGEINQDQIKQWQAEGYKVEKHFDYEPHSVQGTVSAEEAVRSNITVHRSGWADNLTGRIDGNELAGHHTDIATQYAFQPGGGATGMGFAISRSEIFDAGQDGQVELWLSPTRGTQANPFKIIGHVVDNQIVFDAEPGSEAAEMLANKSYALAEVVHAKSGFVMSTEVGSGTADSFIRTAKEMVNTLTGYDITPPVDRVISSVPVTPDVEPLPPVPGYRGTRRLSADDELFERPARAETAPEEEVNPPAPTPSSGGSSSGSRGDGGLGSGQSGSSGGREGASGGSGTPPPPPPPSGGSSGNPSSEPTVRWWQKLDTRFGSLSDREKRERSNYIWMIVQRFKREFAANKGKDKQDDSSAVKQFARDRGLARLVTMSDQGELKLNAYGEVVAGRYDDRKAWQEDIERRQGFYNHASGDGYGPELLDYLAKKSQQPEYSTDKIVSWEEPKITKGDLQSNIKERGLTTFDHVMYDSLFTSVNEDRRLTTIGRTRLAQDLSNHTIEQVDQMGAADYISSFRHNIYRKVDYINKEINGVKKARLTDGYLGGARELLDAGHLPGTYALNTLGEIALAQYEIDSQSDDEMELSLDDFVNSYNTKYSDEQKARWRAMAQREQKYLNDVSALAGELSRSISNNRAAMGDAASLFNADLVTTYDGLKSIKRYLSECQVDGREASVDDFVKGYNAGLYHD